VAVVVIINPFFVSHACISSSSSSSSSFSSSSQVEPQLVKPYVKAFVEQIFLTFESMDAETVTAAVSVVGELAGINPDDVRPFFEVSGSGGSMGIRSSDGGSKHMGK